MHRLVQKDKERQKGINVTFTKRNCVVSILLQKTATEELENHMEGSQVNACLMCKNENVLL